MADKSELITQICVQSGLKGADLDALRAKLSKLSELDLRRELTLLLSGKKVAEESDVENFVTLKPQKSFTGNVFTPTSSFVDGDEWLSGWQITRENNTPSVPKYTEEQKMAVDSLSAMTSEADTMVKEREKEAGPLSAVVNAWQEIFNKELAKSTVKAQIKDTKNDLNYLEKVASGEVSRKTYIGNERVNVSFDEAYKERRGVKFDPKAIEECNQKAQTFAQIKTATTIIKQTKAELAMTTKGDVNSQMRPDLASASIIKAFKLSGVNSKNDINQALKNIEEKYKDHPDMKKYGGDFRIAKNKAGKYVIYRTAKNGYPAEATNEQLTLIAKELSASLDKSYAYALGVQVPENAKLEELEKLTQKIYDTYEKDYEKAFAKAYGKKDLKALSEKYILAQQKGVANIEMGLNIASMAMMLLPAANVAASGWLLKASVVAKNSATLGKAAKTLHFVDKAKTYVNAAQKFQKISQAASPFIAGNMILNPVELTEQLFSENGMSEEEWAEWGKSVLQNSIYMGTGMGVSKLAENTAAMYKTKALINALKQSGKTPEQITALVKANPVKFPKELVQTLKKVDNTAKMIQVPSEVVFDIASTFMLNKALGNGDVTSTDWINSVAFAFSGSVLQKQFKHLNTESKVKYIHDAFKEYGVTRDDAQNILRAMDDISAGKLKAKTASDAIKPDSPANELPEVVVTPEKSHVEADIKTNDAQPVKDVKLYDVKRENITEENFATKKAEFIEQLKNDSEIDKDYLEIISTVTDPLDLSAKKAAYDFLKSNKDLLGWRTISDVINSVNKDNFNVIFDVLNFFKANSDFSNDFILSVALNVKEGSSDLVKELYNVVKDDKDLFKDDVFSWLMFTDITKENLPAKIDIYNTLKNNENFSKSELNSIISSTKETNIDFTKELLSKNLETTVVSRMIGIVDLNGADFARENLDFFADPKMYYEFYVNVTPENIELAKILFADPMMSRDKAISMLKDANPDNIEALIDKAKYGSLDEVSEFEAFSNELRPVFDLLVERLPENLRNNLKEDLMDGNDNISSLIYYIRPRHIKLNDADIKVVSEFLQKHNPEYKFNADDVVYDFRDFVKSKLESRNSTLNDIIYSLSCLHNNYGLGKQGVDLNQLKKNISNQSMKLSVEELCVVRNILSSATKDNVLDLATYDYRNLVKRDVLKLLSPLLSGISFDNAKINYIKEFLFCSDEEFLQKRNNLYNRRQLNSYRASYTFPFEEWKRLLVMSDEKYNRLSEPIETRVEAPIDISAYRADLENRINKPLSYSNDDVAAALRAVENREYERNLFSNMYSYRPTKTLLFQKLSPKEKVVITPLESTKNLMTKLSQDGELHFSIEDEGGLAPTRSENPIIHPEDVERLDVEESAHIKIKYGAKTAWSNVKIARDIMQNFYDGNGHTLEGVSIDVETKPDGTYRVRVSGEGHYDYSHLESLGDSTKDGNAENAGSFGEGTRIVAVNLLAHPDTHYVKYACGDWGMTFGRSSDDIQTADMTQTLSKNEETLKGNYIEFETKDLRLVNEIINSKDYFKHPHNEDFYNFDIENEFFGIKLLPKGQNGNLYIVQRYEANGTSSNGVNGATIVFKKTPDSPEMLAKTGKEYSLDTGRDRVNLYDYKIKSLLSHYAKTLDDNELVQVISSMEDIWKYNPEQKDKSYNTYILEAFIDEAADRKLGINFNSEKYVSVSRNSSPHDIEMAQLMGYKLANPIMEKVGMSTLHTFDDGKKKPMDVPVVMARRIHLIDEAVKILQECTDFSTLKVITESDASRPTLVFDEGGCPNEAAEAILNGNGQYIGHWVKNSSLILGDFVGNVATWLHEISHKNGGDTSSSFSNSLIDMQKHIINSLTHNPNALAKMQVLAELYNGTKSEPLRFNESAYMSEINSLLTSPFSYKEYVQDNTSASSSTSNARVANGGLAGKVGKGIITSDFQTNLSKSTLLQRFMPRLSQTFVGKLLGLGRDKKEAPTRVPKQEVKSHAYEPYVRPQNGIAYQLLPDANELMTQLKNSGEIHLDIVNKGGLNPTRVELPVIHENDMAKLGKVENARIKIRYGAKTNWSNEKIARDIMQNFYDGNGHTMEGVGINVVKNPDGTYAVRITGEGHYDYSHLESLGDSTKDNESSSAGNFGEGTRIVAANLLSKLETTEVKYACGDWKMTFGRSSNDIQTADMTQTLTKNTTPVAGNYIEFNTSNENLIYSLLEAKDYFAHPYNKDFQNMDFNNDFFGFKVQENENGNLYYIQRYQTPDGKISGGLNNLSVSFNRSTKDKSLLDIVQNSFSINNGRDRMAIDYEQLFSMSSMYSRTMTDDELVRAIISLEPIYASDKANGVEKLIYKNKDMSIAFARGLIAEATRRNLKIDYSDQKIVYIPEYEFGGRTIDPKVEEFLRNEGYKFAYNDCRLLGMKSADEVYKKEHLPHSLKPTDVEVKKLRILQEAINLFAQNDSKYQVLPEFENTSLYVYDMSSSNNGAVHALINNDKKYEGMFIDRTILKNTDFMTMLSSSIAATLKIHGDLESAKYSYELTDLLSSELNTFITKPETVKKLQILKKMYEELK